MRIPLLGWLTCFTIAWCLDVAACPFCTAIANTISEDLSKSDVTVVANWLDTERNRAGVARSLTTAERDDSDPLALKDFEVLRVYKGGTKFKLSGKKIQATFRGQPEPNRVYLLFGFVDETINWTAALPLRAESIAYLDELAKVPPPGPERLKHFLRYLDHPEKALADDAYNEFARAPYAEVQAMRKHLERKWLLERLGDSRTDSRRRRLYLTLLGVCGEPGDAATVQKIMHQLESSEEAGLDAAIACYLTLTKAEGVPTIEQRYLSPNAEYRQTYSAIMAIRFHGEEKVISRDRLGAALQLVLDRPTCADLVIADLARWQIWTAAQSIAKLFRMAEANSSARVAAAKFLSICPTAEGKQLLEELKKLDPAAVGRGRIFLPVPPPDAM
jgi:hypothetical protein